MTLKLGGWPWKTIEHLCFAVSSFVQHFIAIGEFQLELQSGNAQFGSNSTILEPCDIEIWRMTLKNTMALYYATSSSVHHFVAIGEFKLELQSGNAPFGQNRRFFCLPCDLAIWDMTLKNNRAALLCYFKLCASFLSHRWFQTSSYSTEMPNLGQIRRFLQPCDLAIWRMTLKNYWAPFLYYFKLCASFRNHWCIETWVRNRKRPIWVKFDDF